VILTAMRMSGARSRLGRITQNTMELEAFLDELAGEILFEALEGVGLQSRLNSRQLLELS
jgi:hypothetical protein